MQHIARLSEEQTSVKWQRKILAFTKHSRCHWIGHLWFIHFPSPLTLWFGIRIRILSLWSKGFEPSFKITRLGLPPWTGHHMMHLATNTSVGRWIPIVPLPSHCHKQLLCEHNLWDIKATKPKPITKPHNPHYNHIATSQHACTDYLLLLKRSTNKLKQIFQNISHMSLYNKHKS